MKLNSVDSPNPDLPQTRATLTIHPIPVVLFCPRCRYQHIDRPEPEVGWTNPPHRSHKCHSCLCIWRPADVCTTGVESVETRGSADTWPREAEG